MKSSSTELGTTIYTGNVEFLPSGCCHPHKHIPTLSNLDHIFGQGLLHFCLYYWFFLKVTSRDKVTSSFTLENNGKALQVCLPGLKSTAILIATRFCLKSKKNRKIFASSSINGRIFKIDEFWKSCKICLMWKIREEMLQIRGIEKKYSLFCSVFLRK